MHEHLNHLVSTLLIFFHQGLPVHSLLWTEQYGHKQFVIAVQWRRLYVCQQVFPPRFVSVNFDAWQNKAVEKITAADFSVCLLQDNLQAVLICMCHAAECKGICSFSVAFVFAIARDSSRQCMSIPSVCVHVGESFVSVRTYCQYCCCHLQAWPCPTVCLRSAVKLLTDWEYMNALVVHMLFLGFCSASSLGCFERDICMSNAKTPVLASREPSGWSCDERCSLPLPSHMFKWC